MDIAFEIMWQCFHQYKVDMLVIEHIRHKRGKVHWGVVFLVMGSEDKFFLMSKHTHSHLN